MTEVGEAGGAVMSFKDHLRELRTRLVRITAALVIGFLVAWQFRLELFDFLSRPIATALADNGIYHFQAIQITESILVYLKVAFFADLVLMSPVVFWQLWGFVAPGLYEREKRFVLPLTVFSVVFFLIGSAFAYTVLLPFITDWLVQLTYDAGNVEMLVTLQNAYAFAFTFLLMFGLVFELPLVIFFMALWGAATGKGLLKFWRYFVVIAFLLSAILTPPDPISQVMMAVPLNILYGFGILVAFTVSRAREREAEGAGRAALRMMGLSLAGAVAVALAVVLVIASLPDRSLLAAVPRDTAWTLGMNPKALWGDATLGRVVAVAFGRGELAAVLLRTDEAPAAAATLEATLSKAREQAPAPDDMVAAALDQAVLIVGHRNLVADAVAVVFDGAPAPERDLEDQRMLKRLASSGPLWAWLPEPHGASAPILGASVAADVANAGAVLSTGDRQRVALHLRAPSPQRVDILDAQLEAARDHALALEADARQRAVVDALTRITAQLQRVVPEAERAAVAAIAADLDRLDRPADGAPVTALARLAPFARGWSVRRNDTWFVLTTELRQEAGPALLRLLPAP